MATILAVLGVFSASPASADPNDIVAAARSVVRVVLVANDNGQVYYVGHGSGVAVAPNVILTNAHVVDLARQDSTVEIGIVPSQGNKSYGGQVISYSSRNDLALVRIDGRVTSATIYTAPVDDGASVTAIGYPGSVDRAQGLDIGDLVQPLQPVKTTGMVSGGRSSREFDTILHTAPMAQGNSGGPLVDNCGRIVGINSFGSLSDGNDAEFGFAVSAREIANLLKKAEVSSNLTGAPCRSTAEISAAEDRRAAAAFQKSQMEQQADNARRTVRRLAAERTAQFSILAERENHMALAGLLLVLAAMGVISAAYMYRSEKQRLFPVLAISSGALLFGSVAAWLTRPSFADIADRTEEQLARQEEINKKVEEPRGSESMKGVLQCALLPDRSRITVSEAPSTSFEWNEDGCVNGRTQYGEVDGSWSRIFVPNEEDTVTVRTFDPETAIFKEERYLLPLERMNSIRSIRNRYRYDQCQGSQEQLAKLSDMQSAIRQSLPSTPNETLVFRCSPKAGE